MSDQAIKRGLGLVLAASIVAMVICLKLSSGSFYAVVLGLAALILVAACMTANIRFWVGLREGDALAASAAQVNAGYMGLSYLWGATAMLAVYRLTDLEWRHDWQYAGGMALSAVALFAYAQRVGSSDSALAHRSALRIAFALTMLQGLGALGGLAFLVGSGKLATAKGDWAASHIFLAGGLAVAALSLIALATQLRLANDTSALGSHLNTPAHAGD